MPIPDVAYWGERFKQVEQSEHREAEKVYSDIEDMYRAADREIEQKISAWYGRFANNNGITMAEARRMLNTRELAEFRWTLQDYIKHGQENGITADWSKQLENASARYHITRLQALQLDLQQSVEVLFGGQSDAFDSLMKQTYLDSYYRTAFEVQWGIGIGFDIAKVNGDQLQTILQRPWTVDGRNFSDKIWSNKTALIGELQKTLQQNVILGYPPDHLIQEFSHKLGVSESNAARLLYTESAYFREISQGNSFRALGVENVIFVATLDERTSDICQQMDGTVIPLKDYQPGVTVPPLHPWCRSTTAPYYKDLEGIGERAARDPDTGKTYWVPRSMKYPEWNQTFVNGGSKDDFISTDQQSRNYDSPIAKALGTQLYDACMDVLGKCGSDEAQAVWDAYEADVGVADTNERKRAHCDWDHKIHVDGAEALKGNEYDRPTQVVFHESGHAIDMLAGKRYGYEPGSIWHEHTPRGLFSANYQGGIFPQTIKDEIGALVSAKDKELKAEYKAHAGDYQWMYSKGYITQFELDWFQRKGRWIYGDPKYSKDFAYAAIKEEIKAKGLTPFQIANLSDMMEGATREKIQLGWGHGNSYWKEGQWTLATEAFAEMYDATVSNHDSLEVIREYLPKSYGIFVDMLKEIVK